MDQGKDAASKQADDVEIRQALKFLLIEGEESRFGPIPKANAAGFIIEPTKKPHYGQRGYQGRCSLALAALFP